MKYLLLTLQFAAPALCIYNYNKPFESWLNQKLSNYESIRIRDCFSFSALEIRLIQIDSPGVSNMHGTFGSAHSGMPSSSRKSWLSCLSTRMCIQTCSCRLVTERMLSSFAWIGWLLPGPSDPSVTKLASGVDPDSLSTLTPYGRSSDSCLICWQPHKKESK